MGDGSDKFTELLIQFQQQKGYTPGQLARRSGLPKMTIINWLQGRVKRPRFWQDVIKLAQAMNLNRPEEENLLDAAGYPPLANLVNNIQDEADEERLSSWLETQLVASGKLPPFQAVRHLPTFVGRETHLQVLTNLLLKSPQEKILVLEGMAGVGKTALAAHLANRLRRHFRDGVLWVRPDLTPMAMTLQQLGETLGRYVSGYGDLSSRSMAIRELLSAKHILLVLDNVQHSQEIELLLPAGETCAILITTRRRNLSIALGAHRFQIEPFTTDESLRLFDTLLGKELVKKETSALLDIAQFVEHLPLALDIIASRLAYEPGLTAQGFLAQLRECSHWLPEIYDESRNLAAVLEANLLLLSPKEADLLAALSTFGGLEFSLAAAAEVAKVAVPEAKNMLRELHCLSWVRLGRQENEYRLISVLQNFAENKFAQQKGNVSEQHLAG